jgi:Fe-S oxidoreductase/nitrate reductase gamma subunit
MSLPPPVNAILAQAAPLLTREIFGNIPGGAKALFYLLALAATIAWGYGMWRRVRIWRMGRADNRPISFGAAARRVLYDVILQRRQWGRVAGRLWASYAHTLLFGGFMILLIGTTLVAIEHVLADLLGRSPDNPVFHKGLYFAIYELTTDAFGISLLVGCLVLLARRLRGKGSFARTPADVGILIALIVIGVTGYIVEGLRIIYAQTPLAGLSPVGWLCAMGMLSMGVTKASAGAIHFALWWFHAVCALAFIALMPYTRLLHALAGAVNLALRDYELSAMRLVPLEEIEATGQVGVAKLTDFTHRQLIELDACVSCGRCQDACPAFEAGKPLSPRNVVQDLFAAANRGEFEATLPGGIISAETLWSCTTCGACPTVCPLGVSPMRMITDMRRSLIGEGALRGSPATALQKTERAGNPWGLAPGDRMQWAAGLAVPIAGDHAEFDVLYWVGCAAAYDRRVQKVARSVVRLLQAANVNFAVLGKEERCTGEAARRMGDELLFQQMAAQNVATLAERRAKRIIAHCPHCLNSLRHDYPQMGGDYEVIHHSEFLAELVRQGRLPAARSAKAPAIGSLTFHDPCYLARANGVTEAPRHVVASALAANEHATTATMQELPRNRIQTSCCGGGGGRMWFDDPAGARVGQGRVAEIAASGVEAVAVACPFCLIMLGDGLAAEKPEMRVRDIAEILADSLLGPENSS